MKTIIFKLKHLLGREVSKKIFILGSGRSGTHWIGYILQAHERVRATIEAKPAFRWVKTMALDPSTRSKLYPKLVMYYQIQHFMSVPHHYLDKSHPNIWLAEQLAETFNNALFVGIIRNPYATVASMLRHKGVLKWHKRWKDFPIPNKFLGITPINQKEYESLPLPSKCAMRWKAHHDQMEYLRQVLGDRLMVIHYESLFNDTYGVLKELGTFVGLSSIPYPNIKESSLYKWKDQLSISEIEQIEEIVVVPPTLAHKTAFYNNTL